MGACCSARSRNRTKPSIDARCKIIVLVNFDEHKNYSDGLKQSSHAGKNDDGMKFENADEDHFFGPFFLTHSFFDSFFYLGEEHVRSRSVARSPS